MQEQSGVRRDIWAGPQIFSFPFFKLLLCKIHLQVKRKYYPGRNRQYLGGGGGDDTVY